MSSPDGKRKAARASENDSQKRLKTHDDDGAEESKNTKTTEAGDQPAVPPHMMYPPPSAYFHPMYGYPPYGYPPFMPPAGAGPGKDAEGGEKEEQNGESGNDLKDASKVESDGPKSDKKVPASPFPFPPNMPPHMMHAFRGSPFMPYPPSNMYMMMNPPSPATQGTLLHIQYDLDSLSDYQILVRQQLELFEATHEDIESNTQGRKKPVIIGQVGLRCRHCAGYPLRARGRGAVYYPSKLLSVYQAAQNMASSHLIQACQNLPPLIREDLKKLRERKDNACGGKKYWADGCKALGVIEKEEGLFFHRESPARAGVEEVGAKDSKENQGEGKEEVL